MNNQPRPHLWTTSDLDAPARPADAAHKQFLERVRAVGGTPLEERSSSAERKRRHASREHDRRLYPYPNHGGRSMTSRSPDAVQAQQASIGTSRDAPGDLITPPRPYTMPRRISGSDGSRANTRRETDVVLPGWQPDGEVSRCPVCDTEFTFWYRKHHCRKCGRVVCAACSPHRITIPRQYIVPNALESPLRLDDEPSSPISTNPALGGGEIVRVCNPCVPDPWMPETTPSASNLALPAGPVPITSSLHRASTDDLHAARQRSERYRYNLLSLAGHPSTGVPPTGGRHRSQSHQPPPPPYGGGAPRVVLPMPGAMHAAASSSYGHGYLPPLPSSSSRPASHRHSQSSSGVPIDPRRVVGGHSYRGQPGQPHWRTPPPPFPEEGLRPTPAVPKRVVKEEDECPVCGVELPPNERFRESHVQECISARFSSGASPPPSAPSATPRTSDTGSTHTYPAVRATPPTASSTAPPGRPRTTSYRPRGMAVYTATEKDCTNTDGEAQECIICFEEFQPSDELGRMECLCKFHRVCIRSWWDRKGGGSCPTHQLQE